MEVTPNESDEEADDEPEPKIGKSSSELKDKSSSGLRGCPLLV